MENGEALVKALKTYSIEVPPQKYISYESVAPSNH